MFRLNLLEGQFRGLGLQDETPSCFISLFFPW